MQLWCLWLKAGGIMRSLILALCVWTCFAQAKTVEKIDIPDEMTSGTQKLVLNGAGLRVKKKLGMNFNVYVAGLYLPAKNKDANAIIDSAQAKVLELVFMRSIDRETLQEAWQEGFDKNCKPHCEAAKGAMKAFNDMMVDVKTNSRLKMSFQKDGVNVDIKGAKDNKTGLIAGEPFRKALMAVFIGAEPPTKELKTALLGE